MADVVLNHRDEIVAAVEGHRVVAVSGGNETHMSSYIPFFLFKAGFTSAGVCKKNPPRICVSHARCTDVVSSAESCSVLVGAPAKVAAHLGSPATIDLSAEVLYVTDDCLMRRVIYDPLLSDFGVVVLTGMQDRLLCTEVIAALLKRILSKRSRLRVVLCFEGGHAEEVLAFFRRKPADETRSSAETGSDVPRPTDDSLPQLGDVYHVRLEVPPSSYELQYVSAPCPNYLDTAAATVWDICQNQRAGNVLIFVPSSTEMEFLQGKLLEGVQVFRRNSPGGVNILPLNGANSNDLHRMRKPHALLNVYICCDLRDYQSKIDSISYVIDCGFTRRMVSDYVKPGAMACNVHATRDEMQRRASVIRGPGKCFRLMTEAHFWNNSFVTEFPISEMKTNDLTNALLFVKSLGVGDFTVFEFPVQPPAAAVEHALLTLYLLGAIDVKGDVTFPCGNLMAELPYTPMLSNFLYRSAELGCSEEALTICAMLEVQDRVLKRSSGTSMTQTERLQAAMLGFAASEGDLLSYFNVYQLSHYYRDEDTRWMGRHMVNSAGIRAAEQVRGRLAALLGKYQLPQVSCGEGSRVVLEAIFKSFFLNVACKEHLVKSLITSRQLGANLKVNTKVVDDEGNALLNNELQPYLLVSSLDTGRFLRLYIHPSSFLANEQPDWVVFNESVDIDGEVFMKDVTAIQPE
ncbi:ATP-dependent helicase, putative [Babesia caballi]|uniref:ATP-dependent helicase, putative n=1 Tax=Babesia caballi TaxID=5871 RepID=A0AAV4M0H1_BABCB|nr:ATP-dependent helicase, putative [Babesia caballi]